MNPLRRRAGMLTLLLVALVAQTTFFPHVRVFGIVPDVMLLAVVAVAAREGSEVGVVFGFAAGVSIDLFLEVPLGLSALSYVIVGHAIGLFHRGFLRARWWLGPALGGSASLAAGLLFVLVGTILGQVHLLALRTVVVIPARALCDAILAIVVFPLTSRLLGPADDELAPQES